MSLVELTRDIGAMGMHIAHTVMGDTVTSYTNVSDQTTDPFTTVTLNNVPIKPVSHSWAFHKVGSIARQIVDANGDFFLVSRDDLKNGTAFLTPTPFDKFVRNGITFRVRFVREIGPLGPGWVIGFTSVDGFHGDGQR